jgi:hypothetical protein
MQSMLLILWKECRYDWPDRTLETVDWEAHRQALQTQSTRRTHFVKMCHDILPIGNVVCTYGQDLPLHCALCNCARLLAKISPTFFVVSTTHAKHGAPPSWTVSVRNITVSLPTQHSLTSSFQDYKAGLIKLHLIQPTTHKNTRLYSLSNRQLAGSTFSKDVLLSVYGNASSNIITLDKNPLKAATALPGHKTLSRIYTQTGSSCGNLVTNMSTAFRAQAQHAQAI